MSKDFFKVIFISREKIMIEQTKCKLCGNKEGKELLNVSDCSDTYLDYMGLDYSSSNRFYKQCNSCGFVFRSVYLSELEKERLYSCFRDDALRNENHEEYFKRISNMPIENSENGEKYIFLEPFLKNTGKHMDIGGGLGVFCYGFQKYFKDWSSICVEPTDGADVIAGKHGVKSYNTYLYEDSVSLVGKDFDLITANHVVEHVDDPIIFLKMLKGFVSDNGIICIEMPSALDIGFLDKTHDRFMSQHEVIHDNKSVEFIAEKAGLRVLYNHNYVSKRGRNNVRAVLTK